MSRTLYESVVFSLSHVTSSVAFLFQSQTSCYGIRIICVVRTTKRRLCRWVGRLLWHCTGNEDDVRLSFTLTEQAGCTDALTCCPCWKLPWVFGRRKPSASCRTTARGKWCSRMRRQRSTPSCRSSTSNSTVRPSPTSIDRPGGCASFEYRPVCVERAPVS